MALEAESVVLRGFWGQPHAGHKTWGGQPGAKAVKLMLAARIVEQAAGYMGYRVRRRTVSGEPEWLEKA